VESRIGGPLRILTKRAHNMTIKICLRLASATYSSVSRAAAAPEYFLLCLSRAILKPADFGL